MRQNNKKKHKLTFIPQNTLVQKFKPKKKKSVDITDKDLNKIFDSTTTLEKSRSVPLEITSSSSDIVTYKNMNFKIFFLKSI